MKIKNFLLRVIGVEKRYRPYSSNEVQVSKLIDEVKSKYKNPKILDVGAGGAPYLDEFKKIGEVLTLDIEHHSNLDVLADIHKLPFKGENFKIVTLFSVLEHLHSPWIALKDINRVLGDEGYIILIVPQYWHAHAFPSDYYRYTKYGVEHLCKQAGFDVVYMRSTGGPFLVLFHVIELNFGLDRSDILRRFLYNLLGKVLDKLDYAIYKHEDLREFSDSVGWAIIAKKTKSL